MANSIKIGNSSISSIKLGSADVDAVYLGSTLVYSAYTPPTPSGYAIQYLTFIPTTAATTFKFNASTSSNTLSYSLDSGTNWVSISSGVSTPSVAVGDKIMWKGENLTINNSYGIGKFSGSSQFDVEGNVMSLLYGDNFSGQTSLSGKDYAFKLLFSSAYVASAENFVLPATTLATQCYNQMFRGCSSLTVAPELPTTTLAQGCYSYMFYGCSGLTTSPILSATTLVNGCYEKMFQNCANLSSITCLATDISASLCTDWWVRSVASSGTFYKASGMTSWTTGQDGIPTNWVVQDYTPPTPSGDSYEQLSMSYPTSIAFQTIHINLNNYYGEIWFASTADTTQTSLQAQWFITENGRYIQCGGTPDYYEISALTEVDTNVYEFTFPEPQYFVPQEIYQNTTFGNVSVLPIFSALTSGFSTTMAFETIRIDTNTIDTSNGASIYTSTVQGETMWTDNTYEIRLNLGIIEYNGGNDHIDITAGTEISTGVYQHTFAQPLYFTADGSYEFNHPQFDLVRVSPANGVGGGGSCSALSIDFSNEVPIYSIKIDLSNYPNGTIYFNTNSGQTNRDYSMDWRLDLGMGRIENDEQGVGIDIRMQCANLGNDVYEWYCPTTLYFVACTSEYEMDNPDFSTVEVCQGCQTLDINTSNELAITSMTFDLSDSWELNSNKIYFNSDSGHTLSDNFMDWKVDLGLGRISNDEQGVAIDIRSQSTDLGNELYQWTCPTTLFFVSTSDYQFDTPNFERVKICT